MAKSDEELKDVERQWDEFQASFESPDAISDEDRKSTRLNSSH